ncbi:MAG TPA: DUF4276 family protein [Phycisphaerae bacterium]|nr:DUF4276 family protein [Phycisphaerae bacterium]HUT60415.1 DUF4276 family protein [Phycisphaerae bacterium]
MTPVIACVVEGHGDVPSMRVLLRRLAHMHGLVDLQVPMPVRTPRSKLIRDDTVDQGELSRAIDLAARKLPSTREGMVLVVIDADESCPAEVAPRIIGVARKVRSDVRVGVVLPKCEFEAWFIAAIESLRGTRGIRADARPPDDPEAVRDAKGYLRTQMEPGTAYSEAVDQPALADRFDLEQAMQCRSFRKLRTELEGFARHVASPVPSGA